MAQLTWDDNGKKYYETGVKEGILFVSKGQGKGYEAGVAWNGLTAFNITPSGAEVTKLYANDSVYANLISAEEIGATIEAYTYPDEFAECDGSATPAPGLYVGQQPRKRFGFVCKTTVGNDESDAAGFKLHILYGCLATPSERSYATINDSPEATTFSWEVTTTPQKVDIPKADGTAYKPTAYICIDSTKIPAEKAEALDTLIKNLQGAGENNQSSSLPSANDVIMMLQVNSSN